MYHARYVRFSGELCTGCADCVRLCPTRAIRLRNDKPVLMPDQCIGCGDCIRICSAGAVGAPTCELKHLRDDRISVALVSPVLYSQFLGVMPENVLAGLRRMGFNHAVDMSYFLEIFQYATEEYILRNRTENKSPLPLISPICPVVVRLIACKFPSLLNNVLPIMRPAELMARDVHSRLALEYDIEKVPVAFYYIVPCPTKIEPSRASFLSKQAYTVKALGFNDIFADLDREIRKIQKDTSDLPRELFEYGATGNSLVWGISGGEIAAMNFGKALAVSGLQETISYLEKIEMGLFEDIEYIEFRTCREGCVGGILTAIDRYLAKRFIQKTVLKSSPERRITREELLRRYEKGWFSKNRSPADMRRQFGVREEPLTIEALAKIEELVQLIRGKNCAACGSPNCRIFAEDVVRGRASIEDCLELRARK